MTMFGLTEAVVAPLVRAVIPDNGLDADAAVLRSPDRDEIADRFARATWTGIAEPGDRVAGVLVRVLGAAPALTAVVDAWPVEKLAERLADRAAERAAVADSAAPSSVSTDDLAAALARWRPRVVSATALTSLTQAQRYGVRLVRPGDAGWPTGVDDLGDHAPIALWMRGRETTLETHASSISLVGARAATNYGEHVTMEASAGLVDRGYTIVSGAAYGVDGMAHRAALASSGETIAVLAGGVDRFYPSGHDALLARIVESGAVVSELPCGSSPTKWRFLQRNRIIAAMSGATIVLEAGWRSGSLNTAGHAAALGRPLGAVPGPVTSAASAGCHRLIREFDAVCVTSAEEMAELAPLESQLHSEPDTATAGEAHSRRGRRSDGDRPSAEQTRVLDAVTSRSPRTVDDIAARSGLAVDTVRGVLGTLDLEGVVRRVERGWVR
ncbi:DNA-processing protein DprA [Marisediminicola sp. LYQ134]|uniref:DNA-processing protein DprA n=1 Tax=Marisediminicola sp. LYQ134 TaxID=3391061 RepID=UPI003983C048